MNLHDAERMARSLMDQHGLSHWRFKFDRAKQRFGLCDYNKYTISLSHDLTVLNGEDEVRNTILHEIAHALAGNDAGHGYEWKSVARSIGCTGDRCYDGNEVKAPTGQWIGVCPGCGNTTRPRHRRRKGSCSRCSSVYDERFKLQWRKR